MTTAPEFSEAVKLWGWIGLLSFGGPAGQIALLHKEIVDQRSWIEEKEFLGALNFCMFLPGPEAMQLATYCGWKLHGLRGGLAAGLLFVLPGALVMLALSLLYATLGNLPLVQALFWGIKAAVVAIVFEALIKIARRALKTRFDWAIAAAAFVALFVFALPFALVVAIAGVLGFFLAPKTIADATAVTRPTVLATLKTIAVWLVLWLLPLALLHVMLGRDHVQSQLAGMFSVLAVVTFGGAYSVLASLGQTVVEQTAWLTPQQMMDGFGLAETTPGPLILVGQFVSFTAATHVQGSLWAGVAASLNFLWMTFVPCFLWILAGAPWIEYLQNQPHLKSALSAITAAATGVILNLSLWFALHVVFAKVARLPPPLPIWWPDFSTLDVPALVLCLGLAFAVLRLKAGIPKTLALAAIAGLSWHFVKTFT